MHRANSAAPVSTDSPSSSYPAKIHQCRQICPHHDPTSATLAKNPLSPKIKQRRKTPPRGSSILSIATCLNKKWEKSVRAIHGSMAAWSWTQRTASIIVRGKKAVLRHELILDGEDDGERRGRDRRDKSSLPPEKDGERERSREMAS
ncbi:hypothetical protein ACLOJK_017791 [Asimina triloba]